jgi:SAM-dependent methyltransferase
LVDYKGTDTLTALEGAANYNRAIEQLLLDEAGVTSITRVLDVGSGGGEFATRLRDRGISVECVELDPMLRANLVARGFVCHADVSAISSKFDVIMMVNVLEHIEHDADFLRTLRPLLAENARLFIFVPALQILYSKFDKSIGHFRRYSKVGLHDAAKSAGLSISRSGGFDVLGIAPALAFRLLRRRKPSARAIQIFDGVIFPLSHRLDSLSRQRVGKNRWIVCS